MQPDPRHPLPALGRGDGVTPEEASDAPWLVALAGRPDPQADPVVNAQALALRAALLRREARLDARVPPADETLLQQLQFRLRREGLTGRHPAVAVAARWPVWGLAATVVLGVALYVGHARLASLQAALQAAGSAPRVSTLPDGRIRLEMAATPAVLDELARQRLEPLVVGGQVTLLLVPTAP
jgi:hypothetical protein